MKYDKTDLKIMKEETIQMIKKYNIVAEALGEDKIIWTCPHFAKSLQQSERSEKK